MNFTVYSKDGCPFCTKVVQVLELAKLNHVVYKLGDHFDADGFYGQFGNGSTFPQVVTMPPSVFEKMYNHVLTDKGLQLFDADWASVVSNTK